MIESTHVLVVGDGDFTTSTADALAATDLDADVLTETRAEDVLERLGETRVDCIVASTELPGTSGFELLAAVRSEYQDRPFVLVDVDGSSERARRALEEGATDVVEPVDSTDDFALLAQRVANAVERDRARQRYQSVTEGTISESPMGVLVLDADGTVIRANDAFRAFFDLGGTDLAGQNVRELVTADHEDHVDQFRAFARTLVEGDGGGRTTPNEFHVLPGDDREERWVERRCQPIESGLYAGGRVEYFVDVTERKAHTRERHKTVDRVVDTIVIVDGDWRITFVDDWPGLIFDTSGTDLLGRDFWDAAEPELGAQFEEECRRVKAEREPRTFQVHHGEESDGVDDDGWSQVYVYPEADGGLALYFRDISEWKALEAEYRRERTLSQESLDALEDVFYVIDTSGNLVRWNQAAKEVTGYTDEELAEMNALEFFEGKDQARVAGSMEEVLETGSATVRAGYVTKDGERIPYEYTGSRLTTPDGELRGIIGIGRDISNRLARERELERAEQLFQHANEGMFVVEVTDEEEFVVRRVNPAYEELTGLDGEEVEGMTPREAFGEDAGARIEERYRECADLGTPMAYEEQLDATGESRWWQATIAPVVRDGEVIQIVGTIRDVTERKERNSELVRYETLFEESADVNVVVDPEGRFEYVTPSAEHVFGYDPDELIGEIGFEYVHPADREEMMAAFGEMIEDPSFEPRVEFRFQHRNGSWIVLEAHGKNLLDDPDIEGIVIYTRDVTERKRRKRELELKNRAIEEAPVGITVHDARIANAPIYFANDRFQSVTGYEESAVNGRPLSFLTGKETSQERIDELERAMANEEAASVVLLLYRNDGTPFWGHVSVAPVRSEDGSVTHFAGFLQDVSEAKEYEQRIERRFDEFSEVLAEDLRTPLEEARDALSSATTDRSDPALETTEEWLQRVDDMLADLTTIHSFTVKSLEVADAQSESVDAQSESVDAQSEEGPTNPHAGDEEGEL